MAHFIARERNEHGFLIFVDELKRLFGELRDFRENLESVTEEYIQSVVRRLEEAHSTLQLLTEQMSLVFTDYEVDNEQMRNDQRLYNALVFCLETTRSLKVMVTNYIPESSTADDFA